MLVFKFSLIIFFGVWEDRALRERNLSAQTSVDCESIQTGPILFRQDPGRDCVGCQRQPRPKRKTHFIFSGPLGAEPRFGSSYSPWERPPLRSR